MLLFIVQVTQTRVYFVQEFGNMTFIKYGNQAKLPLKVDLNCLSLPGGDYFGSRSYFSV